MICQQVPLSGDAEWPKVADAVIEAALLLRAQGRAAVFLDDGRPRFNWGLDVAKRAR